MMNYKVKVTVELVDPETDETIDAVSSTREPKITGVHLSGWPAICTAREAYEAAMMWTVQDERWAR